MEPAPTPSPYDPDLDPPRPRRRRRLGPLYREHQRLIANPFLALFALIPWFFASRHAVLTKNLQLSIALLACLAGVFALLQFHCLDCGATDHLFLWKRHACEHVRARQLAGTRRRFLGPNPVTQTVLWFYGVAVLAFLAGVVIAAAH